MSLFPQCALSPADGSAVDRHQSRRLGSVTVRQLSGFKDTTVEEWPGLLSQHRVKRMPLVATRKLPGARKLQMQHTSMSLRVWLGTTAAMHQQRPHRKHIPRFDQYCPRLKVVDPQLLASPM